MEEVKVMELPEKSEVEITDQFIIEDEDGTKLGNISSLKKIMINNLIFKNIEEMKSASLKEGEVCITLGYHTENDGGGGQYLITYSPALVEDKANTHYLYTSDTLRAEFVSDGTVTPEQFGAYGDGTRDDYKAIMLCMNSGYDVHFIRNHKYRINTAIPVDNDTFIDFNGCTIIPQYCDGVSKVYSSTEDPISNVTLKNVTFDMENGSSAINIQHPTKNLNIENVTIKNEKLYGMRFGSLYKASISNCAINTAEGNTVAVGIGIDGDIYTTDPYTSINISDTYFNRLYPAVSVNCIGNTLSLNMTNCSCIHDTTDTDITFKNILRIVAGIVRASVDSIDAINLDTLFTISSESYTTISNIFATGCSSLIDNLNNSAVITIGDNIVLTNPKTSPKPVINRLYGTLINNCSKIIYSSTQEMTGTTFTDYSGNLIDHCDPSSYDMETVTGSSATLRITGITNKFINITGSADITSIEGGLNGQRILLKSTMNKSITELPDNIEISSSPTTLGAYTFLELKKINGVWTQIS